MTVKDLVLELDKLSPSLEICTPADGELFSVREVKLAKAHKDEGSALYICSGVGCVFCEHGRPMPVIPVVILD